MWMADSMACLEALKWGSKNYTLHTKTRQAYTQKTWSPLCEFGACCGVWLIYPLSLHWWNWFFLSQQVSIADCFLVRGRTWCPLLLSAQILCSWNMYRSFVCCHGLWVHMYISLLSLEGLLFLELSIISSSSGLPASTWAKISEGRCLIKTSHLGSLLQRFSFPHCPLVGLY